MHKKQFEIFKSKIDEFRSNHIKVDNLKFDEECGAITLDISQIPKRVSLKISDDIILDMPDVAAISCLEKADAAIKKEAIKDVVSWISEKKKFNRMNIKGIDVLLESEFPDDVIVMNYITFLAFRQIIEKY